MVKELKSQPNEPKVLSFISKYSEASLLVFESNMYKKTLVRAAAAVYIRRD